MNADNIKINQNKLNIYLNTSSIHISSIFSRKQPFVDLTVTSPPYWNMKKYGDIESQTGYKQSYKEYLTDIRKTFQGVYDISKDTSSLFVIVDTMKRNGRMVRLPDDISNELESIGWIHQDTIIWDKGKTLPWSRKGQMRNVFEYILMFTKSNSYKYYIDRIKVVDELMEWWIDYPERYNPEGKVPENIWRFPIPTQGSWGNKKEFGEEEFRHACPFPPDMMARILLLSSDTNDVILDPYAGTGVLLATAQKMGRRYIGFDTNPDYKKVFEQVTIPLIAEKWPTIEAYYSTQAELKKIMSSAIYKLRVLKYQKALIKKLRSLISKEPYNKNKFTRPVLLNIALAHNLTPEPLGDQKIGRVDYLMVINEEAINYETLLSHINNLTGKAPFTKYGLLTTNQIITITQLQDYLAQYHNNTLYLYTNGNTKDFNREINADTILNTLNSREDLLQLFDKDVPPLVSNIRLEQREYSAIPAIKYEKKTYLNELIKEDSLFDIIDFDN
ncbi:DNA-methyltransferase [Paenibacillus sp. SAFN-117]|uniref:DNA-methyltransferase n=1 Tax=Paenibacillus sp. SAFN-117 TaxID=3436860 RepID=UPI003F7D1809